MLKFFFALFIVCIVSNGNIYAQDTLQTLQDTLPKISVKNRDGRIIISWKNNYGAQISNIYIQRSSDSLKRFTTIGTVLNPMNRENGYVDSRPAIGRIFYRVFIAFEGGAYIYTRSYKPSLDTTDANFPQIVDNETPATPGNFVASKFVFTGRDNNVIINLPNAERYKYSVKFFDENDKFLFQVNIKEPYLILEKVNFLHAGWFKYHLFNNDILLEKYKFFIPKDGRNGASRDFRNK
ncbi:MAG: hypothetical protein JWP81_1878 [Ferruginibacter sp.]|nr:hypothetical protein [Ferruginibacter sp.]